MSPTVEPVGPVAAGHARALARAELGPEGEGPALFVVVPESALARVNPAPLIFGGRTTKEAAAAILRELADVLDPAPEAPVVPLNRAQRRHPRRRA